MTTWLPVIYCFSVFTGKTVCLFLKQLEEQTDYRFRKIVSSYQINISRNLCGKMCTVFFSFDFFPLFHLIQVLIKNCLKAVPGHKLLPPGLHEIRPNLSFHAVVVIVFSPTDSFIITFGLWCWWHAVFTQHLHSAGCEQLLPFCSRQMISSISFSWIMHLVVSILKGGAES